MKKRILLEIKFKDSDNIIKFDLSKNNLFFGFNGKGKTRILTTIVHLFELSKTNNINDFIELSKLLNLSYLKINGRMYDDFFIKSNEYIKKEKSKINTILNENLKYFEEYVSLIEKLDEYYFIFRNYSLNNVDRFGFDDNNYKINSNSFNDSKYSFKKIINQGKEHILQVRKNSVDFQELRNWFRITESIIKEFKLFFHRTNNFDDLKLASFNVEKIFTLNYVIKNIFNQLVISYGDDQAYSNSLIDIQEHFSHNKIKFISSTSSDIQLYLDEIHSEINEINNLLIKNHWKTSTNLKLIDENQKIREIKNKISLFNSTIQKYEKIKLNISDDMQLNILKNNEVPFSKFSSGEKRIVIMLFCAIMSDYKILLIDEPEISLSLNYQTKLMKDLLEITKNKTLMVASHAPYIVEDFTINPLNNTIEV